LGDGTTRRGQVLEVDGEKAVVQVASFLWILFFLTEEWQSSLLKKRMAIKFKCFVFCLIC